MPKSVASYNALLAVLLAAGLLLLTRPAQAQQIHQVVQFTGMVVHGDSSVGVAGVRVSVLGSRRATLTNEAGYFSLPVLAGDHVTMQIHEQVQYVDIPANYQGHSYSAIVQLPDGTQNTTPTEFKSQFLHLPPAGASFYNVNPVFYDPNSLKDTFRQILKK